MGSLLVLPTAFANLMIKGLYNFSISISILRLVDIVNRFTYKVVMEIDEMPDEIFEFYGEPQAKKKDAAHSAANGALWYLKHEGFLRCKD